MKKIIYLISSIKQCGPVNVLLNIVRFIDKRKYTLFLITLSGDDYDDNVKKFEKEGVCCYNLGLSRWEMFIYGFKKIDCIIKKINPDVIHAQCYRSTCLLTNYIGEYKTIATIHCYPHLDFPLAYGKLMGHYMVNKYIKSLKKIDCPVACSKAIAEEIKKEFCIDSLYVMNGVDIAYNSVHNVKKTKLKNNVDRKAVIVVGALIKRKNVERLCCLMRKYIEMYCNVDFDVYFIGDGPLKNELVNNANENMYFLGWKDDVMNYLADADLLVSASLAEGMPMAVLEALECSTPVLLSDIPPHREIIDLDKNIGMTFDINDEKDFFVKFDKMLQKKKTSKMFDNVKRIIGAERMSVDYQKIYRDL